MLDKLFLSTPSARRATKQQLAARGFNVFLSTPSARRATYTEWYKSKGGKISIHALREEGDQVCYAGRPERHNFYPRPPRGGRQVRMKLLPHQLKFLSTPSARRATYAVQGVGLYLIQFLSTPSARRATKYHPLGVFHRQFLSTPSARRATFFAVLKWHRKLISIHALREEGDRPQHFQGHPTAISIHALREEGDPRTADSSSTGNDFYPRPPRGGRRSKGRGNASGTDFYPRPPRGGRLQYLGASERCRVISIHALREEGDNNPPNDRQGWKNFYPRPPRGGRPLVIFFLFLLLPISIHALREEGDVGDFAGSGCCLNFYPRPPRGGRRGNADAQSPPAEFLSTPSARRATRLYGILVVHIRISIHALREEGDLPCPI